MNRKVLQTVFFLVLLGGVGLLAFFIFQPYLTAMFMASVFVVVFQPFNEFLTRKTNGSKGFASFVTTVLVLIIILFPVTFVGTLIVNQATNISDNFTSEQGVGFVNSQMESFQSVMARIAPSVNVEEVAQEGVKKISAWVESSLSSVFTRAAKFTLDFFLMIVALFFLLKDGNKVREIIFKWSPLDDEYDEDILSKISLAVNSVIKGTMFVALIQGLLAGIGFAIFGAPSPVLWGFITAIAALIPSVGTAIIIFPMVIYLYVTGTGVGMAIGLLIWGVIVVGLIDNFLRPILIEKGMRVHPFLILLSVFGGLAFFGPVGFVAGPIVLSFAFALIDVFPNVVEIKHKQHIINSTTMTGGVVGTQRKQKSITPPSGIVKLK